MFRTALTLARGFTFPLILSRVSWDKKCSASIGAFVVINDEGWIVTAEHNIAHLQKMEAEALVCRAYESDLAAAQAIADPRQQKHALRQLKRPPDNSTSHFSAWWGGLAEAISTSSGIPVADISVAKLVGFDATKVAAYPTFKDPSRDFEPGTSLCKLGFPFHAVTPSWDGVGFHLPPGGIPPYFPMDGMFTRTANLVAENGTPPPFPLIWVETSTPGLKGQSGGPTIDVHGNIWAIQVRTSNLHLGFSPEVPGEKGAKEHQFLNVGLGVHPTTMFGLFDLNGIRYQVSTY